MSGGVGGRMYPDELKINDTTPSDRHAPVPFLGMNICSEGNGFRISVFDKRSSFNFPVRRYPHMSSLIPRTIPYGVFLGQLHRGYRICTYHHDFMTCC